MPDGKKWTVLDDQGIRHEIGLVVAEHATYIGLLCGASMNMKTADEGPDKVVTCIGCMAGESETAKIFKQERVAKAFLNGQVSRKTMFDAFQLNDAKAEPHLLANGVRASVRVEARRVVVGEKKLMVFHPDALIGEDKEKT